jgi:hypothetical protein
MVIKLSTVPGENDFHSYDFKICVYEEMAMK